MSKIDQPTLLTGPILRRTEPTRISFWLALNAHYDLSLKLVFQDRSIERVLDQASCQTFQAATHLYYYHIDLSLDSQAESNKHQQETLPLDELIHYHIYINVNSTWTDITKLSPERTTDITYPNQESLCFTIPSRVNTLLHGSCRNPLSDVPDGMVAADQQLARSLGNNTASQSQTDNNIDNNDNESTKPPHPSMLILSGDQIYADHVAGPMLYAIHQVIQLLGFPDEAITSLNLSSLEHSPINNPQDFYFKGYYQREQLLPTKDDPSSDALFFSGKRKPIFTSVHAKNHLITLAEFCAMYLLVWSPTLWSMVDLTPPDQLTEEQLTTYQSELTILQSFIKGLKQTQRLMAHLPVAMIFDDHDISDDWNLHRAWEESAYGNPFSYRIIANGLIAYLIHQGWGNCPENVESFYPLLADVLAKPGRDAHEELAENLIKFEGWGFSWSTSPKLVVLDTRTQRWRSERSATRPSGLMDWESLTELQDQIKGLSSVILVSPPPIFGVKLIEVIQRVFAYFGLALMVDAENWMSHPGSANGILNIFGHRRTPQTFTILSGDVHYSFVYDVHWRSQANGPNIWQICSSGIKNQFPEKLLRLLDQFNRILYSPNSPLNWLTRRRKLSVSPRKPVGTASGRRLLNQAGMGWVEFNEQGEPIRIAQLVSNNEQVEFVPRSEESIWH